MATETHATIDEAISDAITHTHKKGLPRASWWSVLRGFVLWSPLGGVVYGAEHKLVFDKVWARRQEWLAHAIDASDNTQ